VSPSARTLSLLDLVSDGLVEVHDLSQPMRAGMPQSPNHPQYRLTMPRRHGDSVRADGGSAANDLLITGTHVGTHVDALGHVSHCGQLYGGASAEETQTGGNLSTHGVDEIEPMFCRGVLLDVPAALGVEALEPAHEIPVAELERTVAVQQCHPGPGEVILVRSGWGRLWGDPAAFVGHDTGVPGVGHHGAQWLASYRPRAVGADTIAFEHLPAASGHALLPAHRVLLVDNGVHIIETMNLEDLAAAGHHEFLFVLAPLHLVGATGSPVRPLAVVA
jgi:kynurenine formamidase